MDECLKELDSISSIRHLMNDSTLAIALNENRSSESRIYNVQKLIAFDINDDNNSMNDKSNFVQEIELRRK